MTTMINRTTGTTRPATQDDLQATLVELIDLGLNCKQAHWNVTGPLFRAVHHELDEIVATARWAADEVAERLATIGGTPDGRAATVARGEAFRPFADGQQTTEQVVERIGDILDELNGRLDQRIAGLTEADPISQGILIAAAERLQKHAWMLRVQRG